MKVYFVSQTPEGRNNKFKRYAYRLIDSAKVHSKNVLIQYIGDEKTAIDGPHGNSRNGQVYYRTCPSVLKKMSHNPNSAEKAYKEEISKAACPLQYQSILMPRNSEQIRNLQKKDRNKSRISHDAIYNLHEIAYDLGDFVKIIITFPDLIVICGLSEMLNELDSVVKMKSKLPQLVSYDTTFKLGDFYLSPLLVRHTLFSQNPVIPAIFLIHERKFKNIHERMMKHIASLVPSLSKEETKVPLVTDEEEGIIQAIKKYLPGVVHINCWNHVLNAAKIWLRKHKACAEEIPVYVSYIRELLSQPCVEKYQEKLAYFKNTWSQAFATYYMENIHPKVSALYIARAPL